MSLKSCRISDAEWRVMKIAWEESPITAAKIIEALKETDWSPKTIHSLIDRLVKKGALGVDKSAAQHEFFTLVSKEDCIRDETGSFLRKVYDGSFYQMAENFISNEALSANEIRELQKILEDKLK